MTNPNLANINSYLLDSYSSNLTSDLIEYIINTQNSNGLIKINSVLLTNFSSTRNSNITLQIIRSSGLGNVILNNKLSVPPNSRNYFVNKNISLVLNEGDSFAANTDSNSGNTTNSNVSITIGYEEISDKSYNQYFGPPYFLEYLVIAGGGGGAGSGNGTTAGGGGAGGYRTNVSGQASGGGSPAEGAITLTEGLTANIIVGAGGAGGLNHAYPGYGYVATEGSVSSLSGPAFTAVSTTGGGRGAAWEGFAPSTTGGSGGGGSGTGAAGTANEGYAGGNGAGNWDADGRGGGGGGAGGVGGNGVAAGLAGAGGAGVNSTISGTTVMRGGGGGGSGAGGAGGTATGGGGAGGNWASTTGTAGTANTGGGGGAGSQPTDFQGTTGGNGGSGIIILRHTAKRPIASNTTGNVTITSNSRFIIYRFTSSGSITF